MLGGVLMRFSHGPIAGLYPQDGFPMGYIRVVQKLGDFGVYRNLQSKKRPTKTARQPVYKNLSKPYIG